MMDAPAIDAEGACTLITSDNVNNNSIISVLVLVFDNIVISYRFTSARSSSNVNDSSWAVHELEINGERIDIDVVVTLNKMIYAWGFRASRQYREVLFSMEVVDDVCNTLMLDPLYIDHPIDDIVTESKHWVESLGCIYYVKVCTRFINSRISLVKVLKLDLVGRKWVDVKSLDGRAFFIGKNCSTWCLGGDSTGAARNCVYFPNPLYYDNNYYCYNLDEGSLTVLSSCSKLQSVFSSPIWFNMMPQHHRLLGVQDVKGHEWNQFTENNVDFEMITRYKEQPQEAKEIQAGESRFTELPDHLIYTISKYMHIFEFWNFRASCNTFQSAVPPVLRPNKMHPLFVDLINNFGFCKIIDPSRDDPCFKNFQLSSDPFNIDFSKDGWIVNSVGSRNFFKYLNLFTGVKGDFPSNFEYLQYVIIGFSTYPTSPDCVTVAIVDKWDFLHFNVFQYGDEIWRVIRVENSSDIRFCPVPSSPLYFAGSFNILDEKGYLGVFTLVDVDGKESRRVYSKPPTRDSSFHSIHLVECDGELHAVFIGEM